MHLNYIASIIKFDTIIIYILYGDIIIIIDESANKTYYVQVKTYIK